MFSANIRKQSALICVKSIRVGEFLFRVCHAMWLDRRACNQGVGGMKTTIALTAVSVLLVLGPSIASSQTAAPAKIADTTKGKTLVDADGMTLYTFDRDSTPGKSVCNGKCASNWPPFGAAADAKTAGDWSVFARDDGSRQWAYKGKPLYKWMDDQKPGDVDGDGRNNVWHVATP
jgi:predicted lipoprotein with Yx(FWY)xxD motif